MKPLIRHRLARAVQARTVRFINAHILVAIVALSVGSLFGPLQAFEWSGLDLYGLLEPIGLGDYYKGLTIHGVLNALVWTTFFITGFLTLVMIRGLNRPLRYPLLNRIGFWTMVVRARDGGDPDPGRRSIGAVHLLPAARGELGLLPGSHAGGRRQLDRGLRLLPDDGGVAEGQPCRPLALHRAGRTHHHGAVAVRHARRGRGDPHDAAPRRRSGLVEGTSTPSSEGPSSGSRGTRWCTSGSCRRI